MKSSSSITIPKCSNIVNNLRCNYRQDIRNISIETYSVKYCSIIYRLCKAMKVYSFPKCHKLYRNQTTVSNIGVFRREAVWRKDL